MTLEEKLRLTIEKLSRLTVSRGATEAEESIARQKMAVLQKRLKAMDSRWSAIPPTPSPERAARMRNNMAEWDAFLDTLYKRMKVSRPKPRTP